jgi:acyl-CoA reductase-like NAD-dependent aldehyde dehydrogenase
MILMTIDGADVLSAETHPVVNPATGEKAFDAPVATIAQLDEAMDAAARAFRSWSVDERARTAAMLKAADAAEAAAGDLIDLLIAESGKPRALAGIEPSTVASYLRYFASLEIPRETLQDDAAAFIELVHKPMGVVAAITPWNFPLNLAVWKLAPALRAGNTVVLKPSPFTPMATLRLGQILAGVLPPGVVNVVSGGDDIGAAMSSHPVPRKVSLTGSIAAGKKVFAAAAGDLKRLTLELGGNDAAIIMPDADVAAVSATLLRLAFLNSGQACALPKRIYAPIGRYEKIVAAFADQANALSVGGPDDSADIGPLSTKPQFDRVVELAADAAAKGARVVTGGHVLDRPGYFFEPTVVADVDNGWRIVDEEQFGPVLPIIAYDSLDEAVRKANDTEFGLTGSVWGSDEQAAAAVAERLECGVAFVNTHAVLPQNIPFGGSKSSGFGVENGLEGLLAFTEPQVVHRARA